MERSLAIIGLLWAVAACRCEPKTSPAYGEAAWRRDDGVVVVQETASVDFGGIDFGTSVTKTVRLANVGAGPLTIEGVSGSAAAFELAAEIPATLGTGDALELHLRFSPPALDRAQGPREYRALFALAVSGAKGSGEMLLEAAGRGASIDCNALPESIDFGAVLLGETRRSELLLRNPTDAPTTVRWQVPYATSGDGAAFSWQETEAIAELAPRSEKRLTLTFLPTAPREHLAFVKVQPSGQCAERTVRLTGIGVAAYLAWEPSSIDCGWVPVGAVKAAQVRVRNLGERAVTLSAISALNDAVLEGGQSSSLVLGAGQHTDIRLNCSPVAIGSRSARLEFQTSLAAQPRGVVPIVMKGGGPKVDAWPNPVNFGLVPYIAGSSVATTRHLTVRNVGTLPFDGDPKGNLHLRTDDAGVPVLAISGSGAPEVAITAPAYAATLGLEARFASQAQFALKLTPLSLGQKDFNLHVWSDDVMTPELIVPATAHAVMATPCQLRVSPTVLDFGLISPGQTSSLHTTLTNLSNQAGDRCYVTAVDVDAAGKAQGFELVGGPLEAVVLEPGASTSLSVRLKVPFDAQTSGPRASVLEFEVSNPARPVERLPLRAVIVERCLVALPAPLQFGLVPVGCSQLRAVTLYNACAASMNIGLPAVAGPGFSSAYDAGLPALLAPGASAGVAVAFHPTDAGIATGTLTLPVFGSFQLVELRGEGAVTAQVTETFVVPAVPTVDILMTVSSVGALELVDGGNWPDWDPGPLRPLADMALSLADAGIDFHLAFTNAHWDYDSTNGPKGAPPMGSIRPPMDAGAPTFLVAANPDLGILSLRALLNAKAAGYGYPPVLQYESSRDPSCFEAALRALTEPLRSTWNAGFVRAGVPLAIVCQSYLGDASNRWRPFANTTPQPVPFYWSELVNAMGHSDIAVHALAPIPGLPDCPEPYIQDPGNRFHDMAQLSGGSVVNICQPSWTNILQSLQTSLVSFQRRFRLKGTPDPNAPIVVRVNGVPLATSAWQFVPSLNTIELNSAPPGGAQVSVTFSPRCD